MMNNYVSKEILSRASRASCFAKVKQHYLTPGGDEDFSMSFWFWPRKRTPMERVVAAYRAAWGWLVIATLLASGILAVLSTIYE